MLTLSPYLTVGGDFIVYDDAKIIFSDNMVIYSHLNLSSSYLTDINQLPRDMFIGGVLDISQTYLAKYISQEEIIEHCPCIKGSVFI